MLEELYTFYLPKKTHPWCYISLEIDPQNVDVNVHPTKHEVKFLHESSIIERMKVILDEKLSGNSATRTFYVQSRLPKADITEEVLKEVLPDYENNNSDKTKKVRPQDMIRTDSSDQKLDKFNFTTCTTVKQARNEVCKDTESDECINNFISNKSKSNENTLNKTDTNERNEIINIIDQQKADDVYRENKLSHFEVAETQKLTTPWSTIVNDTSPSTSSNLIVPDACNLLSFTENNKDKSKLINVQDIFETSNSKFEEGISDNTINEKYIDIVAEKARKQVHQYFGNRSTMVEKKSVENTSPSKETTEVDDNTDKNNKSNEEDTINVHIPIKIDSNKDSTVNSIQEFKSYSINTFRREVKLTSILKLRKKIEDECHEGLKEILSNLTFIGCIDQSSTLIQSGVNLYLCNTKKIA